MRTIYKYTLAITDVQKVEMHVIPGSVPDLCGPVEPRTPVHPRAEYEGRTDA